MATWQYRAWIVPADRLTTGEDIARRVLDEEDPDVWTDVMPGWGRVVSDALQLSPSRISWSPETLAWGTSDGTNVSEDVVDGRVEGVGCNIDVRALDANVIERLSDALRSLDAVLVTAEGDVAQADPYALFAAIHRSSAFRFVEDAQAFLEELERKRTRH